MAVSRAYLCTEICKIAGHVRKDPKSNCLNKKELLIVFAYVSLLQNKKEEKTNQNT